MKKLFLFLILSSLASASAFAEEKPLQYSAPSLTKDSIKQIMNKTITDDFLRIITFSPETRSLSTHHPSLKYDEAKEKFFQGNITAAYKDFKELIDQSANNDFLSIGLAYKFANIGLFSLAQEAINNVEDKDLYKKQIDLIKTDLFPRVALSYDEEIYLAQNFTEIYFNNLAFEVVREMGKKKSELTKRSDYANYILAQGYANIKEYSKAQNAVNKAISINPENANYQKLKAQIYCENNKFSDSVKTINNLLSMNIDIMNYKNEVEALKYYTLAKSTKDHLKTKYYLARYFFLNGNSKRAVKELTQNITQNKKDLDSLTLLGEIFYVQKEFAKASDYYDKAYKIKKSDARVLRGMGDINLFKKDYKTALDFYLKASKKDRNPVILARAALCYKLLDKPEKAVEMATKALRSSNENSEVYYVISQVYEKDREGYLKKAVHANPSFSEAWLDLTGIALAHGDIALAKKYLEPVRYLDPKSYKYEYFTELIKKKDLSQNIKEINDKI